VTWGPGGSLKGTAAVHVGRSDPAVPAHWFGFAIA
jgi:hypothetical protein